MSKVLAVTGMHRSGTSLTANWLQKCGLYIGDNLIPADPSNAKGHFEDREISHFQREILASNGLTHLVSAKDIIHIETRFYEKAKLLLQQRESYALWGWKDPRTCVLLEFWKTLIPDLKVIFVFRHYSQVVSSLLRRDNIRNPFVKLKKISTYACVWERYNWEILHFVRKYQQDTLLLSIETLLENSLNVVRWINNQWNTSLHLYDIRDIFDNTLLHQTDSVFHSYLCQRFCPPIVDTYIELLNSQSQLEKYA